MSGAVLRVRTGVIYFRAHVGIRTQDLILTKNVLCLLSYVGATPDILYSRRRTDARCRVQSPGFVAA